MGSKLLNLFAIKISFLKIKFVKVRKLIENKMSDLNKSILSSKNRIIIKLALKIWINDTFCNKLCDWFKYQNDRDDCKYKDYTDCNYRKGNFICDIWCNNSEFNYDGGDCNIKCKSSMIGDNFCDEVCNTKEYEWDKGDCEEWINRQCTSVMINDGFCDKQCNNKNNKFDGGDCS